MPYEIMRVSLSAMELVESAVGKTNSGAASDLGVAVLSLRAAVQGTWLNILININGIHDESFIREYRTKGETIIKRTLPLADNGQQGD